MNDTTHNYWQQDGEHAFTLFVGGERRATVDTVCNRAVLLGGENRAEEKITAPDSKVIFNVVEDRLDLRRVNVFKPNGAPRAFANPIRKKRFHVSTLSTHGRFSGTNPAGGLRKKASRRAAMSAALGKP